MNRFFLLFALVSLFALSAAAGTVTFDTNGTTLCIGANGCGTATQTFGSTTITYKSSINTVNAPSFSNFGTLTVSCNAGGTGCGSDVLPIGLTLYININQFVPSAGSGQISGGTISGTISGTSSSASITWSNGVTTKIGSVNYMVSNNPLALVPPASNSGVTTIQAFVSDVPEPSSILLLSSGLAGLFIARRRRS